MIVAGLTGNFGVGKSEAAQMFKDLGATILDADYIGHQCLETDEDCIRKVKRQFGHDVFKNEKIDRSALAKIVFNNVEDRRKLEEIIHPIIRRRILDEIGNAQQKNNVGVFIVEAALLIEAGWYKWVDRVIVVQATKELQIKRVQERSHMSEEDILKRLQAQYAMKDILKYADYVINNQSTRENMREQVTSIYDQLLAFY